MKQPNRAQFSRQSNEFNVVPHLAEARRWAGVYGESVAVYRYLDAYPTDVFYRVAWELADVRQGPFGELVVVEAVVAPAATGHPA